MRSSRRSRPRWAPHGRGSDRRRGRRGIDRGVSAEAARCPGGGVRGELSGGRGRLDRPAGRLPGGAGAQQPGRALRLRSRRSSASWASRPACCRRRPPRAAGTSSRRTSCCRSPCPRRTSSPPGCCRTAPSSRCSASRWWTRATRRPRRASPPSSGAGSTRKSSTTWPIRSSPGSLPAIRSSSRSGTRCRSCTASSAPTGR